ncbi:hypothetical protein CONCODRAFT_8999 [Conidiobolus coronatus NRRL 28638]|uniref:Uncharacterized protein n=1 Tax=Conidiobolus coronatus (strain ATCC 28846 / CBS 209.66 / NRRL 28638) TaxID=796925 RepID=A0A137P0U4_CONC2|nr:hypothetical protein CONCODRAFT_8999 [Conidiobolus coronatus NRRL 28638]|eukprot:KXN68675.1 hypothetical protein CONCODRAFT_8999 [Conidiobolus coronatus NRRL 28638]
MISKLAEHIRGNGVSGGSYRHANEFFELSYFSQEEKDLAMEEYRSNPFTYKGNTIRPSETYDPSTQFMKIRLRNRNKEEEDIGAIKDFKYPEEKKDFKYPEEKKNVKIEEWLARNLSKSNNKNQKDPRHNKQEETGMEIDSGLNTSGRKRERNELERDMKPHKKDAYQVVEVE